MVVQRFTIHEESDHTFQVNDVIKEIYPGPNDGDGLRHVVEREVKDLPAYWPGIVGTATVTNSYGVAFPLQHGVWVAKPQMLYFVLFNVKGNMRNMWQESTVTDFVPDLSAGDLLHQASRDLAEAKTKIRLWKRRYERVDEAKRALISDVNKIMRDGTDAYPLTTSMGATLKGWLTKRGEGNHGGEEDHE